MALRRPARCRAAAGERSALLFPRTSHRRPVRPRGPGPRPVRVAPPRSVAADHPLLLRRPGRPVRPRPDRSVQRRRRPKPRRHPVRGPHLPVRVPVRPRAGPTPHSRRHAPGRSRGALSAVPGPHRPAPALDRGSVRLLASCRRTAAERPRPVGVDTRRVRADHRRRPRLRQPLIGAGGTGGPCLVLDGPVRAARPDAGGGDGRRPRSPDRPAGHRAVRAPLHGDAGEPRPPLLRRHR